MLLVAVPFPEDVMRVPRRGLAGPAFFGQAGRVKYEAAYLFGRNSGRAANTFSMRAQYLF